MQNMVSEEQMIKIASFNGIDVYNIKTGKFKTNTINIFFHDNLSPQHAGKNALLPAVLRRGCERFPSFQEIALYLEELYGASFDCGIAKKGERQIIQFYIEFVSDVYTGEKTSLFEKAFELLFEIITKPALENGTFKKEYTEQEKENLKRLIESRVNDKVQYAVERCYELMCKDEPFGIYEYGSVEDLNSIDNVSLYEHYRYFLETLPVSVFITGNVDDKLLKNAIDKLSAIKRGTIKNVDISTVGSKAGEVKNITDNMNVSQAKLSLGFRTNTAASDEDYYALVAYNGILGGGGFMHSKLFQNVREKESLAYYVFSRLEKFKGLMVISSGIEAQNRDKAYNIILKQMDEIKNGNITDYEYDSTLKSMETGIKSLKDSQLQIVDFYLSQVVAGTSDDLDSIIDRMNKVTKEEVIKVANKIKLDTVYLLTGEKSS